MQVYSSLFTLNRKITFEYSSIYYFCWNLYYLYILYLFLSLLKPKQRKKMHSWNKSFIWRNFFVKNNLLIFYEERCILSAPQSTRALLIYHAKSDFIFFCQAANISSYWLYFFPHEELPPHAKNNECDYWWLQIWIKNLHNWHFLKFFVQIP